MLVGLRRQSLLLSVESGGRYLKDGDGNPFFLWGESAWLLGVQKRAAASNWTTDQNAYLDDRKAKGINSILLMLLSRYQDSEPANADGDAPFTTTDDFATPNSTYFNKMKDLISRAGDRGMVVGVAPCWAGYNESVGQDYNWWAQIVSNGSTKCYDYGVYVGNLLNDLDNIYWIMGGDKPGSFSTTNIQAMADGIRSVDTRHLMTAHWNFAPSDAHAISPEHINGCYAWGAVQGGPLYDQVRDQYDLNDGDPTVCLEARYDLNDDWGYTFKLGRLDVANSILMGSRGFYLGHEGIWCFSSQNNDRLGSQSQGHPYDLEADSMDHYRAIRAVFNDRDWHTLIPDPQGSTRITSGRQTYGDDNYVGLSYTSNGRLMIAYVPDGGSVTFDMSQFTASGVRVRYYDPTSLGTYVEASGSPFTNSGSQTFTASSAVGNNAAGATDWLIVLEVP